MKLLFFGSGAFGLPTLQTLYGQHEIVGVVTQPDRPAGRSRQMTSTPIGAWAAEKMSGTRGIKPDDVNAASVINELRSLRADAWVIIAFGQKLSHKLLEGTFSINLHASLLPRWRGAAPIHHAIIAGDEVTGNSVIEIADRMDAGGVFDRASRHIEETTITGELHDALAADGQDIVLRVLAAFERGDAIAQGQDESQVTLARKLGRADAWIDFARPARECSRRVNGLSPWPGVRVRLGESELKLIRAKPETSMGQEDLGLLGSLVEVERGIVQCKDGSFLGLLDVQPTGSRPMAWGEYVRGYRPAQGISLEVIETC